MSNRRRREVAEAGNRTKRSLMANVCASASRREFVRFFPSSRGLGRSKAVRTSLLLFLTALTSPLYWGCGGGGGSPAYAPPSTVSISLNAVPASPFLIGTSTAVSATVANDSQNMGVDWYAGCISSKCGTFSPTHTASGASTTYTAPASLPGGSTGNSVNITARSTQDPNQKATVAIVLTDGISVAFTQPPPASSLAGVPVTIAAYVAHDVVNPLNQGNGVDWIATCGTAPGCGSFNPVHTLNGAPTIFTSAASLAPGTTVTISAYSTADSVAFANANLVITAPPISISMTKSPPPSLRAGATAMLAATVAHDSSGAGVDWTVTCASSNCGSFNPAHTASGAATTFTAPATVPTGGIVTLTAAATADHTKSVQATVIITLAFAQAPPPSLVTGGTAILAVTVNDPSGAGVDWTVTCGSSNCGSFNPAHTASGAATTFTAPASAPFGETVTLTATATGDHSQTVQAIVTIAPSPITIAFTQAPPASLQAGATAMLTATVTNDPSLAGVDWTVACGSSNCGSFNPAHTASGAATTFTAPAAAPNGGIVTLTATATANHTQSVQAVVSITTPPITIAFTQAPPAALQTGTTAMLAATVTNDSSGAGVDWTVSCGSSQCGSFNPAHTASGAPTTFTAPAAVPIGGIVTLTATATANHSQNVQAVVSITTTPPPITIAFTQAPPASLQTGTTAMLATTVSNDPSGAGVDWTVTCSSSNCGSLNPAHTASGASTTFTAPAAVPTPGIVTLTATATADHSQSVHGTVSITTTPPPITITFTQVPPASLQTGTTAMLAATVSNDSSAAGVDWTVTCGSSNCGSFNPAHTASGSATTFTAPAAVPSGGIVTLIATATADHSQSVHGTVSITTTPPQITITFTQAPPASLQTGATAMLAATVSNDSSAAGVDWTVACGSSNCGSFNPAHTASGAATTFTAPAVVPAGGIVTLTATATANHGQSAQAIVSITPPISIAFTQPPPASLQTGATAMLSAAVTNDSSGAGVDWTCAPLSACGTFSPAHTASGAPTTFTAPATVPSGSTVTIVASATAAPGVTVSGTVAITPPIAVLLVTPPASLEQGAAAMVSATVSNDPGNRGVDWTATCGTPNCGTFSPPHTASGVTTTFSDLATSGDTVTLKAVSTADPTKSASANVAVTPYITLAIISAPSSLQTTAQTMMSATVSNDSANLGVDWSATCNTLPCGTFSPAHTASGVSTTFSDSAPAGDTVTLAATSTADHAKSATATVPITALIAVSIVSRPTNLETGAQAIAVSAVVSNDPANRGVDWTATCGTPPCGSFNPAHTASGANTTFMDSAPGGDTVILIATSTADPTKSATAKVPITAPIVVSILSPPSSLETFAQAMVSATVSNDSAHRGIDWTATCSSASCGSFSPAHTASGVTTTFVDSALAGDTVTLIATSTADPTKFAQAPVSITAMISVTIPSPPMFLRENAQAALTADVANDATNAGVDWTVSCGQSDCGSFNPMHTASGDSTTYSAPASVPQGGIKLFVAANSTADPKQSAQATIDVFPPISLAFSVNPPGTMQTGTQANIAVTVNNDPQNQGVTWSAGSCGQSDCGSFNPVQTLSGVTTTYTAPATAPPAGTVTITAASVTDPTQTATAMVNVTAAAVISVTLSQPPPNSLTTGSQAALTATVTNDASNMGVDWSVTCTNPNGPDCGSFSPTHTASGVQTTYTAPANVPSSGITVTLTAASTANSAQTATATVTITPPVQIALTQGPPNTMEQSATASIIATVANDPNSKGMSWTVACGTPPCGTVNPTSTASGLPTTYTAPASVSADLVVTITAAANADMTKTVSTMVTVTPLISVTITQQPSSVNVSATAPLAATVANDLNNLGVDWTVDCGSPGNCGSLSPTHTASGMTTTYTAPASEPAGDPVTITAASTADSTKTTTASVFILPPLAVLITQQPPSSLNASATVQVTATVTNDPQTQGVIWTVSCGSPGGCGSFSPMSTASGVATTYTAPASVPTPNSVTITATSVTDPTKMMSTTMVTIIPPISVAISQQPPPSMNVSSTAQVAATVSNDLGNQGTGWTATCGSPGSCGSFSPTNSPNGAATTYTAPASVPNGNSVTITATSITDPTKTATASAVTILPPISVSISQQPPSQMNVLTMAQVTATVANDPKNQGVNWTIAGCSGSCGTFSFASTASGAATTYTAPSTVPNPNTVTITATSVTDPTKTATAVVTILPPISISLSALPPQMNVSTTAQVTATVANDPKSQGVNWTIASCSGSCGTFSPNPTASGAPTTYTAPSAVPTPNAITITATSVTDPTKTATAVVNILPPISVSLSALPPQMNVSTTAQVTATVANDPKTQGVNWTATCGGPGSCGSFNPPTTASGAATTYTAPASVPSGSVTITATSITDPTKAASSTAVTILPPISIAFSQSQSPPLTILTSATAQMAATVTNDLSVGGVDWTVTCGGSNCGSFNLPHTASGATTSYTAPATVPSGASVTIKATSTTDTSKSITASVTITALAIAVTINLQPPASIQTGATAQVAAAVANDSSNAGVDWSLTCDGADCGSFSSSTSTGPAPTIHQAIGSPVTYTAPATVPPGNEVTLTATSTADPTKSATAIPVRITSLLQGQYAFLIAGQKGSGSSSGFYVAIGSITADGAGRITAGNEDFFDPFSSNNRTGTEVPLIGNYSIGPDGRGTITLTAAGVGVSDLGSAGTETLSVAVLNPKHALITEFDSSATSSGTLDLQDPSAFSAAAFSGAYAFTLSGIDTSGFPNTHPLSLGGVLTANGSGAFTAVTEDINDLINGGTVTQPTFTGGDYEFDVPMQFGRGTAMFTPSSGPNQDFFFYVVDSGTIRFIETDLNGLTAGSLFTQGSGQLSNASLSGSYAFTTAGSSASGPLAAGGLFTANQNGNLASVTMDVNNFGAVASAQPSGTYSIASNGRGTLTFNPATGSVSQYAVYPTLNQGALLVELDKGLTSRGTAFAQTSASTLNGNYAVNLDVATQMEEDLVGQAVADGIGAFTGEAVDVNSFKASPGLTPAAPLTGSFTASSNGRFTGKLNTTLTGDIKGIFYVLDPSDALFLGTDSVSQFDGPATGVLRYSGITVTFVPPTPSTIGVSSPTALTATVSGDPSNAGVDWVCSGSGCGSFNPAHTASGGTTIYTAPATGTVTITARSTADGLRTASFNATITMSPVVSISLTQPPPASLASGAQASITATVANDSGLGVDWSVTCSGANCGSLNPTHTNSAVSTSYTAPAAVPVGNTVTIIATSTADNTKSIPATVIVTSPATIALTTPLPGVVRFLDVNAVTATVSNDPVGLGVNWSVTCPSVNCGSFNPAHTLSGSPTSYQAPPTQPEGGQVSITATATANLNQFVSQDVQIFPHIVVTFVSTAAPPVSIQVNSTAKIAADVANDLHSLGVDWTVTCGSTTDCGSFNPPHTASDFKTTYTAPATIPTGTVACPGSPGPVPLCITATSTEDPTKSASSSVTITGTGALVGLLNGQYAFLITGTDYAPFGLSYTAVGSIKADGKGMIISGEEDYNDQNPQISPGANVSLTGTYQIGADGRGQMTLQTGNGHLGVNGTQTLSFTMVSPQHALVTEFDGGGTSSGTLDLQTPADFSLGSISGGYAFTFSGFEAFQQGTEPPPLNFGGVVTAAGDGTITTGIEDVNDLDSAVGVIQSMPITGTYNDAGAGFPDSFGRGESTPFQTASCPPSPFPCDATFVYYIVDKNTLHFIENDGNGVTAGSMFAQGPGPFSLSGPYAFTAAGRGSGAPANPLVLGGLLNSNGSGNITSILDVNNAGTQTYGASPSGSYTIAANGRGTLTLQSTGGVSQFAVYLTLNQGVKMLELDKGLTSSGTTYAQSGGISGASFRGNYAASVQAVTAKDEEDLVGQAIPDGISSLGGTVDFNQFTIAGGTPSFTETPSATLSGGFTPSSNGRFTGAATTLTGFFYVLNDSTVLFLGADKNGALATGVLQSQVLQ